MGWMNGLDVCRAVRARQAAARGGADNAPLRGLPDRFVRLFLPLLPGFPAPAPFDLCLHRPPPSWPNRPSAPCRAGRCCCCAAPMWCPASSGASHGRAPISRPLATCWRWPGGRPRGSARCWGGCPPNPRVCCLTGSGPGRCILRPRGYPPDGRRGVPFAAVLVVTLLATWYGTYYLARSPGAQPVAFAFGGEANPPDYARAMADGALLALIACLGLAQLSHEMSSHLAQLGC